MENTKTKNKTWLRNTIRDAGGTHALTLNFTTDKWTYNSDQKHRVALQQKAEEILYKGFECIAKKLYGPRHYKKNIMNRIVVYEYGKAEKAHRLHAHCVIDLSDWKDSPEKLAAGVKTGISKCRGLADNEYDFQEMYYQEDGYGWEDYITKFVNYSDFSTIDLRNSKIKKD